MEINYAKWTGRACGALDAWGAEAKRPSAWLDHVQVVAAAAAWASWQFDTCLEAIDTAFRAKFHRGRTFWNNQKWWLKRVYKAKNPVKLKQSGTVS
jgi:hypothetical protein